MLSRGLFHSLLHKQEILTLQIRPFNDLSKNTQLVSPLLFSLTININSTDTGHLSFARYTSVAIGLVRTSKQQFKRPCQRTRNAKNKKSHNITLIVNPRERSSRKAKAPIPFAANYFFVIN